MWNSPFCLSKPVVQKTHQKKKGHPPKDHTAVSRGEEVCQSRAAYWRYRVMDLSLATQSPWGRTCLENRTRTSNSTWCVRRSWQQHCQQSQQESTPLGGHDHFNQAGSPTEGKQTKIQTNNDSSARNRAIENPPSNIPVGGLNHQRSTQAHVLGLKVLQMKRNPSKPVATAPVLAGRLKAMQLRMEA